MGVEFQEKGRCPAFRSLALYYHHPHSPSNGGRGGWFSVSSYSAEGGKFCGHWAAGVHTRIKVSPAMPCVWRDRGWRPSAAVLSSQHGNCVRQSMTYEWDEAKNRANLSKHGVSFEAIALFDWETAVDSTSDRNGESRTAAIGYLSGTLFFVVYTPRGENSRIISLRPASRKEREFYERTRRI